MNYWVYFFIFGRFFGALLICPLFTETLMPKMIKSIVALLFAVIVFPRFYNLEVSPSMMVNIVIFLKELLIGVLISYVFSFPFWLIENVGNIIDLQRGEQFGAVVNQLTKDPASSISKLMFQAFIAYFMVIGGLLFFLKLIFASFLLIGPTQFVVHNSYIWLVIKDFGLYFYWLVVLALPAVLAMFLLELILGLFSSFIPQLNVTVLSMPLKSVVALLVMTLYLGSLYHFVISRFVNEEILNLFKG